MDGARRADGIEQGFDEYMNMVIIQAVEVKLAQGEQDEVRTELGKCTFDCSRKRTATMKLTRS